MSSRTTTLTQRPTAIRLISENKNLSPEAKAVVASRLLHWDQLADWQKADTKLIQSGYRKATPTIKECIQSWTYLHNETVNIFSHLFGAVLFLGLAGVLYTELSPRYPSCSSGDIVAFAVFMSGVAICFGLSAAFHTCASHSPEGYKVARQLDFQGIVVLVLSTSAPQVFYTFYTEPFLRYRYWTVICCFGVLASVATLSSAFAKPSRHSARVFVFAGLGLSTFLPIVHGTIYHGWREQSERFPLWTVALTHTFNITGAIVYVLHFPERWWPKTFDLFGSSHQLMHCSIIGAALTLLVGSIIAFDHVHGEAKVEL